MDSQGGEGDAAPKQGKSAIKGTDRGASRAPREPGSNNGHLAPTISRAVKEEAKRLYMQYVSTPDICESLGVNRNTFRDWVKRGDWYGQREGVNRALAQEINKRRAFTWNKIVGQSTEIIAKYVAKLSKQGEIDGKEARQVAEILGQLDKAMRLAQGAPTDVVEHTGNVGLTAIAFRTQKEIKEAIAADPMTAIELDNSAESNGNFTGVKDIIMAESDVEARVLAELREEADKEHGE